MNYFSLIWVIIITMKWQTNYWKVNKFDCLFWEKKSEWIDRVGRKKPKMTYVKNSLGEAFENASEWNSQS